MVANKKASTIEVFDGLYLQPIKQSPNLQIYFRHGNKTYRKSAGTDDVATAKRVATVFYKQVITSPAPTQQVPFSQCGERYLNSIKHDGRHKYHKDTYQRHLLPFFGKMKTIANLSNADIEAYVEHRRDKNEKPPTPATINRENTVLRQLLTYSKRVGLIDEVLTVPHLSERGTRQRRPHFTLQEYRALRTMARNRIGEAQRDPKIHHVIENRRLLFDVIILLANSGLRVDELHDMTWRDVMWAEGDIKLNGAGKQKSTRKLVVKQAGMNALARIRKRRMALVEKHGGTELSIANERVISMPNGTPVESMKRAFSSLVRAAKILPLANGTRHSMTSLRHTYATFAMTNKERRVPKSGLSKQMGTSERMIEQYYGHDEVEDYRDLLK
jgi:integrase